MEKPAVGALAPADQVVFARVRPGKDLARGERDMVAMARLTTAPAEEKVYALAGLFEVNGDLGGPFLGSQANMCRELGLE